MWMFIFMVMPTRMFPGVIVAVPVLILVIMRVIPVAALVAMHIELHSLDARFLRALEVRMKITQIQ
jgi:hypothetical protein